MSMMSSRPLEGIRVIDLTQAYSGPFCTMHLADHGAEVIKVESHAGDQCRTWGPFKNGSSAYFAYINRNKKGIVLDLKSEEGKQVLRQLIQEADVICENFKVGTFEKLGFSYEELKKINPNIIYASISGFGLTGSLAKRPCYDIVAQAMSGLMSITGHPESPCVKVGPSVGDNYSGTYLALGICMALYQRERTGEGCQLDVSMLDTLFSIMENAVVTYTVAGEVPARMGNIDPGIAPFDSFKAKDGDFVMGCGTDTFWKKLCGVMERPDLLEDPRYMTNQLRCDNYLPELKNEIEAWSKTKTVAEIEELIVAAGIPFGNIFDIKQATEQPQIKERNMLWPVFDTGIGEEIQIPGTPIKFHGEEDCVQKAAPLLGENTTEILKNYVGLSEAEIESLRSKGAIG